MQVVGCSQLHAVVAAQAKCFCIHSGFFDQRLGDISALGDDAPQTLIAGILVTGYLTSLIGRVSAMQPAESGHGS